MHHARVLRYILVAALFFAFGTVHVGVTASAPVDSQLQRQDLGDDDGDGIPNFLDPDDDDDDILDADTPAPPVVPQPDPEPEPDVPDETNNEEVPPVETDSGQVETPVPVTTPDAPSVPEEQQVQIDAPVAEVPQQQQTAPQVSSLPETGAGHFDSSFPEIASMILAILATGVFIANLKLKNRMS